MRYIGTSLGRCLRSILKGEVSSDQVFLISTGTRSTTKEQYLVIVEQYYQERFGDYDITQWSWNEVAELAIGLWDNGKIHQPRNFGANPLFPTTSSPIWFEIIPPQILKEPAAKDLWEKLKVIARLYE